MHLQIRKASHSGGDPEAVPSAPTTVGLIRWYDQASLRAAADYIDRTFMKPQRNLTELAGLNVNEFQAENAQNNWPSGAIKSVSRCHHRPLEKPEEPRYEQGFEIPASVTRYC